MRDAPPRRFRNRELPRGCPCRDATGQPGYPGRRWRADPPEGARQSHSRHDGERASAGFRAPMTPQRDRHLRSRRQRPTSSRSWTSQPRRPLHPVVPPTTAAESPGRSFLLACLLNQALLEPLRQRCPIQVAADEDHPVPSRTRSPRTVGSSVEEHVDSLKDEAIGLTRQTDDTLHAK